LGRETEGNLHSFHFVISLNWRISCWGHSSVLLTSKWQLAFPKHSIDLIDLQIMAKGEDTVL
jgi:hypothetical protein